MQHVMLHSAKDDHVTAHWLLREAVYLGTGLTGAEHTTNGKLDANVPCVLFTPKCQLCGARVPVWVQQSTSLESISAEHIDDQHRVILALGISDQWA